MCLDSRRRPDRGGGRSLHYKGPGGRAGGVREDDEDWIEDAAPPPPPIHELVGRCWEEEWIPLSPPALHRHRLLKTMNGVSFSLPRPSLCVSLSLCLHPHLFLSCDPMNSGLYMYYVFGPRKEIFFTLGGGGGEVVPYEDSIWGFVVCCCCDDVL